MGCVAAGIFDPDKPVMVGNIYFDRSGKEQQPLTFIEEMDHTLTDEIDSWVQDVVYAVKNNEDASRDIPAAVCEKICSHFTACRGELEMYNGGDIITDTETLTAIEMYVQARETSKQAEQEKKEAQLRLQGINGSNGSHQVRWVEVAPTNVNSFQKDGYMRLDVRKLRKTS